MADVNGLIAFWFGDWDDHTVRAQNDAQSKLWWGKSDATDRQIRKHWLEDHLEAARREMAVDSPAAAIANILLLDQIPRNAYRDTPHMFATDGLAQRATRALLDGPMWADVPFIHRYFALMPLMHAEDLASHDLAVEAFGELAAATAHLARAPSYASAVDFEQRHRRIIERFGRYPHRNALLGRESTPEEVAFLDQPGSSF